MDLDRELNPEQKEAVLHGDGPLLILAGAGSGKTRVITYRIAHLIRERDVRPYRILAVTFTNKAAGEMKERVQGLCGEAKGIWISTFHAFGARVLREHAERIGWGKDFVIYDADDSKRLGRETLRELDLDPELHPVEKLLGKVERAKHRLKGPGEGVGRGPAKNFYIRYQKKLQRANAFDFSDLLYQTWRVLAEHPQVLADYRERFRHVLVDEFQDTDRAQYSILRLLCPPEANLCVVGDDDQSIYMWRDADVKHILGFKRDFPSARVVKLERNYRSTANILQAAGRVISMNRDRHEKELWTEDEPGEPLRVEQLDDEREEAEMVAREIYYAREEGLRLSDMAVFYRVNAQSRALEEGFRLYGLPYVVVGGTRFFDRMEIRDLMAYLRLTHNPRSDVDLARILNVPARGIGKTTRERLLALAAELDLPVLEAIEEDNLSVMRAAERKKVLGFKRLIEGLAKDARGRPAEEVIELCIERSGYKRALQEEGGDTARGRLENLQELVTAAMEYGSMTGDSSLEGFLQHVALVTDLDMADGDAEAVSLMTLHSAKGLEFDWVFVTGMEEGLLPHYRSLAPDEEGRLSAGGPEEERRLCYVGMTRARKRLFLSCVRRRVIFGRGEMNPPSRFLGELEGGFANGDRVREQERERERERGLDWEWGRAAENVYDATEVDLDEGDDIVVDYSDEYAQETGGRPQEGEWIGMQVDHATFGRGRVVYAQRSSRGVKLSIDFKSVGRKTVYSNYVRPI